MGMDRRTTTSSRRRKQGVNREKQENIGKAHESGDSCTDGSTQGEQDLIQLCVGRHSAGPPKDPRKWRQLQSWQRPGRARSHLDLRETSLRVTSKELTKVATGPDQGSAPQGPWKQRGNRSAPGGWRPRRKTRMPWALQVEKAAPLAEARQRWGAPRTKRRRLKPSRARAKCHQGAPMRRGPQVANPSSGQAGKRETIRAQAQHRDGKHSVQMSLRIDPKGRRRDRPKRAPTRKLMRATCARTSVP